MGRYALIETVERVFAECYRGVHGQLHHAYAAESLLQPLCDLPAKRIDARLASTGGQLPIDGLAQCTGDRRLTAAQFTSDLSQDLDNPAGLPTCPQSGVTTTAMTNSHPGYIYTLDWTQLCLAGGPPRRSSSAAGLICPSV